MKITHKRQMWVADKPECGGILDPHCRVTDGQSGSFSAIVNQFWDQLFASQNSSASVSEKVHSKMHTISVQEDYLTVLYKWRSAWKLLS